MSHRAWPLVAPPPPLGPPIAWAAPGNDPAGTIAENNSGSEDPYAQALGQFLYAGVVGYSEGDVAWSAAWSPLFDPQDVAQPVLTPMAGGRVSVTLGQPLAEGSSIFKYWQGLMVISAAVDGAACSNSIEYTCGDAFYGPIAWDTAS